MKTFQVAMYTAMLAVGLTWSAAVAAPAAGDRLINGTRPGQRVRLKPFVVANKINIFDFYSKYCGPCTRMAPLLEQFAEKRHDVVVNRIDINRPNVQGIDWGSPVAQQYKLEGIPQFKVFDEHGELIAEGDAASGMVLKMLKDSGVIQ